MPPWNWMAAAVTSRPASDAAALGHRGGLGEAVGAASAVQEAKAVAERAVSVASSIWTQRCEPAWQPPTGVPNWRRSLT